MTYSFFEMTVIKLLCRLMVSFFPWLVCEYFHVNFMSKISFAVTGLPSFRQ